MDRLQPGRETLEKVKNLEGAIAPLSAHIASFTDIPDSIDEMLKLLREAMGDPADLSVRDLHLGKQRIGVFLSLDGMVDHALLHDFILQPIFHHSHALQTVHDIAYLIEFGNLPAPNISKTMTIEDLAQQVILGHAIIYLESIPQAWAIDIRSFEHRQPSEPTSEETVSGSREGFIEVLQVNLTTIRRQYRSYLLRVEQFDLGKSTKRRAAILHVLGRADPTTVEEIKKRVHAAPWDSVIATQQLVTMLEDRVWSLFPQFRTTERPDVAIASLNEGRVIVLLDGSPFAIIAPTLFGDFLQSPDDYYLRWPFAFFIRGLRYFGLLLTLTLLPLYVAVLNYHQELIPTYFILTLIAAREGVPFPTVTEAVLLNLGFDFIREASTRMPKTVGGAITIVGALIIGQSAVQGGLISAPMVILIGLGAVSAFVIPQFNTTIPFRVLNYVMLVFGGVLGLFGLSVGLMLVVIHLASIRSMGVPFLTPMGPFSTTGWQDMIVRLPWSRQVGSPPLDGSLMLYGDDTDANKRPH